MKPIHAIIAMLALLTSLEAAQKYGTPPENARTIKVKMAAIGLNINHNRLGAHLPSGRMYVLENDLTNIAPSDSGDSSSKPVDPTTFKPGEVYLKSYKRPRPIVLRANQGDILEIEFRNLIDDDQEKIGVQIFGLEWLSKHNNVQVSSGGKHTYRFYCAEEGCFMLMSPNGDSIASSNNDHGLFGAVNIQPREAEYYRSQVTHQDLRMATLQANEEFKKRHQEGLHEKQDGAFLDGKEFGLPEGIDIREKLHEGAEGEPEVASEQKTDGQKIFKLRFESDDDRTLPKVAEAEVREGSFFYSLTGQPLINYNAIYPPGNARGGLPVLSMLQKVKGKPNTFELVHSDLTAIITGPNAGRFPFHLNGPSFRENPATPDRRQPYREFSIMYHISVLSQQAFAPFQDQDDPLYYTLQAGKDAFAINYGIAGIGPEIYANRINKGPQGYHKDGVDLKFEEFFLSSWAVGDPAILVDIPANIDGRATKALFPDDPSNVYHSYMRDHTKFRVLNTGSVAPHVHHQHAHQWLHTPNSDDGHYLDSQMINPGATYTMEMTYNGSGNRNQTVGDSIFHCHFYPHFAQGMWSLWRVHDVFEKGTKLDRNGIPIPGARALPDGEIARGTPIPAIVPLPTIGMAPIPAKVRLAADGRRSIVTPEGTDKDGNKIYKNPGFPFFVPGVAGHRAPHPPMDFAWKEDAEGKPAKITAENADAFNSIGDIDYLDGGLPRHVVLNGDIVREFHSRWDYTKDFAAYDEEGNFIKGSLTAVELPDLGTPIEQAAMKAHATRTHATHLPQGLPGNFILNGLPPSPGAPYASPDVDDNGNSNFEALRYKAAVVQTDVVFNKQGWHYPQQRFITLLDDVKPTISGERPPEPFFFRANTGETIEFWHTNLVPAYYEMDDFQVRTPTDIIGQHIHLVKFDVMASDGAGNGFNYEDGTFSPDEVRDRIHAINAKGGLYHFNEALADKGDQSQLKVTPYQEDYGNILGDPPAGQNWNGAQTTIQRFDTDALLNNEGEDRTLRTVFTHDHFGPSTHQQVGLYGALLVEPSGSRWIDAITGEDFLAQAKKEGRTDGGPTSWQGIIETADSANSFREFAVAVADLQLAYRPGSKNETSRPKEIWFQFPAPLTLAFYSDSGANQNGSPPNVGTSRLAIASAKGKLMIKSYGPLGETITEWAEDELKPGPALDALKELIAKPWFPNTSKSGLSPEAIAQLEAEAQKNALAASGYRQPGPFIVRRAAAELDQKKVPKFLIAAFGQQGAELKNQKLSVAGVGPWIITRNDLDIFEVNINADQTALEIRTLSIEPGWADPTYAIWPPTNGGSGNKSNLATPSPTIISDPGGGGNIGIWVANYRNEPLDERVKGDEPSEATDPSFAFASIERNEPRLNSQPAPGTPILAGSDFKYPDHPLVPGMGVLDPYTPLLRAYANDKVEVRAIVGAVDSVHSFRIQGNRWFAEPSSPNSGFRDVQGFAISEHFEMNFQLPPGDQNNAALFADFLYVPSTSTQGLVKGSWGVMRSFKNEQDKLAQVSNNPVDKGANSTTGFYAPPSEGAKNLKKFTISAMPYSYQDPTSGQTIYKLRYLINGKTTDALVLRANAGDWIEVTVENPLPENLGSNYQSVFQAGNNSSYYSSETAKAYQTSSTLGLHPLMLSYDTTKDSGINVGQNPTQTVAAQGTSRTYNWYAGAIDFVDGQRKLTPIEFGGVNLLPSDPMMQQSFGLFGALVIEPEGATWAEEDNHKLVAQINDADGKPLFTEIVIAGTTNPASELSDAGSLKATAKAGSEVRFRVLNSGNASTPGTTTDNTNVITVQGHPWQEEPYQENSTVIGNNPVSQAMGTQQVTSLESYNLVIPSAGGAKKTLGDYTFFYYPTGNPLGTLTVTK